jgi:hypothetical protein
MNKGYIKRLGSETVDVQLAGSVTSLTNIKVSGQVDFSSLSVGTAVLVDVVNGQHVVLHSLLGEFRSPATAVAASSTGGVVTNNPLLADGSVPLTGNLPVTPGVTIDGYDISVLGQSIDNLQAADSVARTGHTVLTHASHLVATIGPNDTSVLIRHSIFSDKETLVVSNTMGEVEFMKVSGSPVAAVDNQGALCFLYTVTRRVATSPSGLVIGWAAATLVNGLTQKGWISVDARENSNASPNLRFVMHTDIDAGTTEQVMRLGNLTGILGNGNTDFGFATGQLTTGNRYLSYNYTRDLLTLRGADIAMQDDTGREVFRVWGRAEDGRDPGDHTMGWLGSVNTSLHTATNTWGVYRGTTPIIEVDDEHSFIRSPLTVGNPIGARINLGEIDGMATIAMRNRYGVAKLVARTDDNGGVYVHVGNPPPQDNSLSFNDTTGELLVNGRVVMQSANVIGRLEFESTGEFKIIDPDNPNRFGVVTPRGQYAYTTDSLGVTHLIRVDAWGPLVLESELGSGVWRTWTGGTQIFGDPRYRHFRIERGANARAGLFNGETPVAYLNANGDGVFTGEITANAGAIGGWIIGATALTDTAGTTGVSSAVTAGDDIRFWAGNTTPSSAPFRVTEAGVLTASSGTIGGWTLSATDLTAGSGGTSIGLSSTAATRMWVGDSVPGNAAFQIASDGRVYATAGAIGGWTLGALSLTGGNATLHNTGYIDLGTGNDIARLDAANATYRLWVGHATASSAPFRVTKAGALTASNAVIAGEITANSGSIGGWTINSGYLSGTNVGLAPSDYPFYAGATYANRATAPFRVTSAGVLTASGAIITGTISADAGSIAGWTIAGEHLYAGTGSGRVGLQPTSYPFYAGSETPASAPFRVTPAGALTASNATITGTINASAGSITGSLYVGSVGNRLHLDGDNKRIESTNFASGTSGFRIEGADGSAEFNNVTVRGAINAAVFNYQQIAATAGSLVVTKGAGKALRSIITSVSVSSGLPWIPSGDATTYNFVIDIEDPDGLSHSAAGALWTVDDIVRIKDPAVADVWATIVAKADMTTYWRLAVLQESGGSSIYTFPAGSSVINYGQSGDGLVRITADASNNPYISIATHAGSPWTTLTERARLGNLTGISGASGYGLWTDNGFFTGTVNFSSGNGLLDANGMSIYAGAAYDGIRAIKFLDEEDRAISGVYSSRTTENNLTLFSTGQIEGVAADIDLLAAAGATNSGMVTISAFGNNTSLHPSTIEVNSSGLTSAITLTADEIKLVGISKLSSSNTNYSQFDANGHLTFAGTAKPWNDMLIEPSARTTGANAPTFEKWYDDVAGTSRGAFLYSFDDANSGSEKEVFFTMQMSHGWDGGDIHFHVHWVGAVDDTTATPRWGLEYTWKEPGGVFGDTAIVYATGNHLNEADITANKHYITQFTAIAPGSTADDLSSVLIGRLFRDSANAADTYNATGAKVGLLYIDAHYQMARIGSNDEYSA